MHSLNNSLDRNNDLNDYLVAFFNPFYDIYSVSLTRNSTYLITSMNSVSFSNLGNIGLAIVNITDKVKWVSHLPFELSNQIVA